MSRAAYAKLQSAKFAPILDRFGRQADVIDGSSYLQFDLQSEESDGLTCNRIVIQFLALSRTLDALAGASANDGGGVARTPSVRRVNFTFQFYRFPEFRTPTLHLDKIIDDYSYDPNSSPFVLNYIDSDKNASPGYVVICMPAFDDVSFFQQRRITTIRAHMYRYHTVSIRAT